jgi:phage tail-like protein
LSGNGVVTPRLRALRVWSPRFSYAQRFLPAVYREDEASGSLLERWLANCEGTLTQLEDQVVHLQTLFDPRAAPAEALGWLAEWFDVAFDPAWDHRRRRLFVSHAMDLFRWRGTVHGLRVALQLAFDECVEDGAFEVPGPDSAIVQRIRIVESHQTRVVGAVTAGDPGGDTGPGFGLREVRPGAQWTPSEGNAGLADRYAKFLGDDTATSAQQITPFSLAPPLADPDGPWERFMASVLGFVPSIGAADRARWQDFLVARHGTLAALRSAHGVQYESLGSVQLPRDWPAAAAYALDWQDFSSLVETASMRSRWQDFLARRYRRIERLNRSYTTSWPGFEVVPVPDTLPGTAAAQADWLQFERQVLPMYRTAHRFSVLLPVAVVTADPYELEARLGLARRIVELEKPAHTVFDVRFFWAFFRVGEARLGIDTMLGRGSRAPELIPDAVLGRTYVGTGFVGGAARLRDGDRLSIA